MEVFIVELLPTTGQKATNRPVNLSVSHWEKTAKHQWSQLDSLTETDTGSESSGEMTGEERTVEYRGIQYGETIIKSPFASAEGLRSRNFSVDIHQSTESISDDGTTRNLFSDTEILSVDKKRKSGRVDVVEGMGRQYPTMGNLYNLPLDSDSDHWQDFVRWRPGASSRKTCSTKPTSWQSSKTGVPLTEVTVQNACSEEETTTTVNTWDETLARRLVKHVCQPPHFLKTLQPQIAAIGSMATFRAIVSGHPAPEVSWYWDLPDPTEPKMTTHAMDSSNSHKIEILESNRIRKSYDPDTGVYTLTMLTISADDLSNISCVARNMAGRATSIANLVTVRKYH